jgi:serine phosphatase RsbU (regulator of sigma subunit)
MPALPPARPTSGAYEAAQAGVSGMAGGRARGLLVGAPLEPGAAGQELVELLELATAGPGEAGALLAGAAYDVLVLDASLPAQRLASLLEALPAQERPERPAVLLVSRDGARGELGGLLTGPADDVVNGALGALELTSRVRGALQVRGFLAELHRKNDELSALYERVESMARRMADELRLASNVQRSLMPAPFPHPRLDLAREFIPFREIGGDYYDLVPLGPSRLVLAIGDVMGKGVPAALLAANLKACLRTQLAGGEPKPAELVARVNQLFGEVLGSGPRGRFATLFLGVFDFAHGRLDYVNAGHDHPFRISRAGQVEDLGVGGPVLGLIEGSPYETGSLELAPDDVLVLYSDGVTDRSNSRGELYGVERLKEAAHRSQADASRLTLYTLLGEVQGWAGGAPAEDDITLIVAKVR